MSNANHAFNFKNDKLKSVFIWMLVVFTLTSGCSSNNRNENGNWNYKEGYIVAKENNKVLVVRDKVNHFKTQLSEILKAAQPNAIWLSVDKTDYEAVNIGDHIRITIPNGMINQSYPAQAEAKVAKN